MTFSFPKPSLMGLSAASLIAIVGLSGCRVSHDPLVNTMATTAAIGSVAALLFYSTNDGYYYDRDYNRLPRNYRPDSNARIQRVDNIDNYRRQHPHTQAHYPRSQQRGGGGGGYYRY